MQKRGILFLLGFVLSGWNAHPAFETRHDSARSAGMGRAFLASPYEPAAVFSNPAGLAALSYPQATFLYAKPFASLPGVDMNAGHAALALPTRWGSWGVGLAHFQTDGLLREETLALSWGKKLFQNIQVGLTAKRLTHSYLAGDGLLSADDPVFQEGASKSAFSWDAGLILPVGRAIQWGLSARHLNEPNVGFLARDKVSRQVQTGFRINLGGSGLRLAGDVMLRKNFLDDVKNAAAPAFGLEKSAHRNAFSFRLGANSQEYTGGFGITMKTMRVDYAFVMNRNLVEDNAGSHQLGVTCRFRGKKK